MHDGVVQCWPDFGDFLIFAGGIYSVRQKHYKKLPVGINPNRGAGEASMAEGVRSHKVAAGAAFSGHSPAEGASAAGKLLRRGEFGDGRAAKNALVRIHSAVEQHLAERRQIRRGAKYPRVT